MKIKLDKLKDDWYRADFIELPGLPICGYGEIPEVAIAALFFSYIGTGKLEALKNMSANGGYVHEGYLEINDKPYEFPYNIDR